MKKIFIILITIIVISVLSACNSSDVTKQNIGETQSTNGDVGEKQSTNEDNVSIIYKNDFTNEKRNALLVEDIEYLGTELPKNHKNPFTKISKQEFEDKINSLKSRVNQLTNAEVFTEMNKITASIGDSHTRIYYGDNYKYPLQFYSFSDGIYVINADKILEDIVYSKLIAINGIEIEEIKKQLKTLIPHENDKWVEALMPDYLEAPIYMYGLGIIPNEKRITFSFEKSDGEVVEKKITSLVNGEKLDSCISYGEQRNVNIFDQSNEKNYWYEYYKDKKTLYFKYNSCFDMDDVSFDKFNSDMFNDIKDKEVDKFVIDLRHNSGGNSELINPFLESLSKYVDNNPKTEVFVIIGRWTFSSGIWGVVDIMNVAPVVLVGEATGGSPNGYGELFSFELPNSKLKITCSKEYHQLTNDYDTTITPDVEILPSVDDFKENSDAVMKYILR